MTPTATAKAEQRLIPLERRSDWERALEGMPHGFGHTWGSCYAVSLTSGYPTFLYEAVGDGVRILCPLNERPIDGRHDVATPYGSTGFAGTGRWDEFPGVWSEFARGRGYVSAYVGLNPLFGHPSYTRPGDLWPLSDAYVLDLSLGAEALWRNLPGNRRRELRAWTNDMHETDQARLKAFFVETYPRFMEAKDAAAYYRFSSETLAAICDLPNVLLLGAAPGPGLEAVAVFGHTRHAADYLFNVSLPGGERHSVPLIWSAVHRLIERGVPCLNLAGGLRSGDRLADFKRRFGGRELPRFALKQVYDAAAYDHLCRRRGRNPDRRDGFFPPYRDA